MSQKPAVKKAKHRRFLFALIATVLFFTGAEALCRFAHLSDRLQFALHVRFVDGAIKQSYITQDDRLMWRLKPNTVWKHYQINEEGYRDRTHTVLKPPKTFRILCLGDSCTLGWEVPFGLVYHQVFESMANKEYFSDGWRFEVFNHGVVGYSLLQGLYDYRMFGRQYKPDIVTVYFGANDTNMNYHFSDRQILEGRESTLLKTVRQGPLLQMDLFQAIRVFLRAFRDRRMSHIPRVSPIETAEYLSVLDAETKKDGARLVLIPLTWCSSKTRTEKIKLYGDYRELQRGLAEKFDIPLVSIPEMYDRPGDCDDYFIDKVHPTPKGHETIAGALKRCLEEKALLPAKGSSTSTPETSL